MKIGLDLHGVVESNPKFFSELSKLLVANGHEVHLITGKRFNLVEQELKDYGVVYTHFYSIVEEEEKRGVFVKEDENGNPWMDYDIWNSSKAKYCQENGIDLHIDDSSKYGEFFKTPFARYSNNKEV